MGDRLSNQEFEYPLSSFGTKPSILIRSPPRRPPFTRLRRPPPALHPVHTPSAVRRPPGVGRPRSAVLCFDLARRGAGEVLSLDPRPFAPWSAALLHAGITLIRDYLCFILFG